MTNFIPQSLYNGIYYKTHLGGVVDVMGKWTGTSKVNKTDRRAQRWSDVPGQIHGGMRKWMAESSLVQLWKTRRWTILFAIMGFLLGRAMILEQLSPFAIAFFAVVYYLRKDQLLWVGGSLLLGSLLTGLQHSGYIAAQMLVFVLIQKALERYERADISYVPLTVFVSTCLVQIFYYMAASSLGWYSFMLVAVESVLSLILTLIFVQAVPVFTMVRRNYQLKNEEIICLIILLASLMTGTVGWVIGDVSIEHVLSRYLILLFALVGGAPLGASVGVITGLILSLANANAIVQMSLLAFAGLLAGLLREGHRLAVALGMLLGTSILSIYIGNQTEVLSSTWESIAAIALFLLTPRSVVQVLARYIPGSKENLKSQHEYAKRVRNITAGRVEQFSHVFRQLAGSFRQLTGHYAVDPLEVNREQFMNTASQNVCSSCWKRKQCWGQKYAQTHDFMNAVVDMLEWKERPGKRDILPEWKMACVRTEQVLEVMRQQYELCKNDQRWKQQIVDSRQLVADQLQGVSRVMEDLAREIKREGQELLLQEEQLRHALEQFGLSIHSIDVINLEEGNVEIEIVHQYTQGFDECRKIIAPLLSDLLGENITVKSETFQSKNKCFCTVVFGSARKYDVETGIAGAAKGGELLSGDSFSTALLGNGKFAVALSDGMGNGERAREESSAALNILQQLLQSGMDERLAVKSVNSVLMLRSPDEMYATIDMALVDLNNAHTTFMKIGSTPSFIKRGREVLTVSSNNLPVGIISEMDIDLVGLHLHPGDVLVMMTDGIYDAPGHTVNKDVWMKRVISEIEAETPQDFADCLLERVVRHHRGEIYDDMTVIVARIEKFHPEWATFSWPGLSNIERPKVVS